MAFMVAGPVAFLGASGAAVVRGWPRRAVCAYGMMALASLLAAGLWNRLGFPASTPLLFPIHAYQRILDPVDGRACPSWPPCSRYARKALARHGALIGSWLVLDRLIHEGGDLQRGQWVRVNGRVRSWDPLARNDFWLEER